MNLQKAILLVDDEAILLLSMRQELRMKFGPEYLYEIAMSAEEGLSAIDQLIERNIVLVIVISDWLMPGMKGDEFLRIVHEKYPSVKLIMLSGHAEEDQIKALDKEVDLYAFLRKPYRGSELFGLISGALAE